MSKNNWMKYLTKTWSEISHNFSTKMRFLSILAFSIGSLAQYNNPLTCTTVARCDYQVSHIECTRKKVFLSHFSARDHWVWLYLERVAVAVVPILHAVQRLKRATWSILKHLHALTFHFSIMLVHHELVSH